ncbi:MAG: DUF433 domain-containing protein [Anaerolineae bacterium]|nr:DUF433 domain-containing protein [Anaerolineae bacterium]
MALIIQEQAPPLKEDHDGVMRMKGSRVTLDTVIHAFNEGHTAEEIVSHYPALKLADVYGVISYYLNNQVTVDNYLQQQENEAKEIRQIMESSPDYQLFRESLLARQNPSHKSS